MSAVTLLHGFTGSAQSWGSDVIDGLAAAGHTARPLDLPGHGALAEDADPASFTLEATLGRLKADRPPAPGPLVGYSMGGRLALHVAVSEPESVTRLVLESASPGLEAAEERAARRGADEALAERIVREGIEAFVDEWESLPLFESQQILPDELRASVRKRRLSSVPEALAASLRNVGTGAIPSLWDRLPEIEIPTLIIVGARDAKFRAIGERMASLLPSGRLAVVEGAGHAVHLERPAAWCELVVDFLDSETW